MQGRKPQGAGLGFRRELLAELDAGVPDAVDFFELADKNRDGMIQYAEYMYVLAKSNTD